MKIMVTGVQRGDDGKFIQTRNLWSLDNFDDGYLDNNGRFRVWLPTHPRSYSNGYILRSIVAYEAYHNESVLEEMVIHHIDGNRSNDLMENLQLMKESDHNRLKQLGAWVDRVCFNCGKDFKIERWRMKDSSRGKFCSQKCYHEKERSKQHKENISKGVTEAWAERRVSL